MLDFHDELHVFLNTERIGTLAQDRGVMSFSYALDYLRSPDAYPLSQNLPLTGETFYDPAVENFFANLLCPRLMAQAYGANRQRRRRGSRGK